jgi:hypothetical protein
MSNHSHLFDQTAGDLRELGYPALSSQILSDNDVWQLTISLPQAQPLQITVFFLNDLLRLGESEDERLEAAIEEGIEGADEKIDFLQLFIRFPFEFAAESAADLARLVNMINWTTPVGTFGINELQKIIYYRQVLEWHDNITDPTLILSAVSGMSYYAAYRLPRIQAFAAGELTMDAFLQSLRAANALEEEFPGYDLRN